MTDMVSLPDNDEPGVFVTAELRGTVLELGFWRPFDKHFAAVVKRDIFAIF